MNIGHNEQLREQLAAEYVVGTLRGGARRRFETWMTSDAALRRAVAEWQDRLCPLAEFAPTIQPPPQLFREIERRLDIDARQEAQRMRPRWRDSLNFWRGLGIASTAMVAVLATFLLVRQPATFAPAPSYIAVLSDEKAQAVVVITGDTRRRQLAVKVVTPQQIASDKSLELWALPKDGMPRSLGLVGTAGEVNLPMPENATPQSVPAMAISLEPKGGSPNPNAPSGPVLFKGPWLAL
jgi:anti-sigma-K factor RskA